MNHKIVFDELFDILWGVIQKQKKIKKKKLFDRGYSFTPRYQYFHVYIDNIFIFKNFTFKDEIQKHVLKRELKKLCNTESDVLELEKMIFQHM